MEQNQWEVIILKPTNVFLSFLSAQLSDIDLPNLSLLQTDTTAYLFHKQPSEEATLDEIERHFPEIFRHEISRSLGQHAYNKIEGSFLDFLCCFKFELHSQIVLMEPSIDKGHQLLCINPRSVLLKWMKSSGEDKEEPTGVLERVNLSHLVENSTVIVKNFKQSSEVTSFIHQYYRPIFKAEMLRMCDKREQWPTINTFQEFSRHFTVEFHSQLIHLS